MPKLIQIKITSLTAERYREGDAIIKYIDLFAGAGGLSEGFIRAGFEAVAHIEMNPEATNTLKTRLAYWYLRNNGKIKSYYSYLRGKITRDELYALVPDNILSAVLNYTMSKKNLKELFKLIDDKLLTHCEDNHIHLIVGGPPCQAYSLAGRAKQRREETARKNGAQIDDDERKYLYLLYCQFAHISKLC